MRRSICAFGLGVVVAGPAVGKPDNITAGEVALLPEYCAYTQSFERARGGFREGPSPGQVRWIAMMGDTFWSLHHYCWALVNANRAMRAGVSSQQRAHLLNTAISDNYYVLQHATPDFPLTPEILLRIGQYNVILGRPVLAIEHFERSRQSKPDYWPAYLEIARVNARLGRRQAAIDILNAGLAQVPDQPQLLRALADLGVKRSRSSSAGASEKAQ